jgi:putative transposase
MRIVRDVLTYRFRLYPTEQQANILKGTIETCRHLYNDSLGERSQNLGVDYWEQKQLLTLRKLDNKYYKQVNAQVLQDVLLRLDKAYQAFFKKLARYPKFKRRDEYNSFSYPQYGGFKFKESKLLLSCIGTIKINMHRIPVGTLKRCTIIRDVDQWYCCITADDGVDSVEQKSIESVVGVDVGLDKLVTLSTGEMIANPKHLEQSIKKIKELQRSLSRKQKDSKTRQKVKAQLAKAWRCVRNQRADYAHKVSTELASTYDAIVFEKLNINNMVKNHNLAAAIMDATWGKLRQLTAYKAERRSGRVIFVNPSGTSQKCSGCRRIKEDKIGLDGRTFECHSCGLVIDRDLNAALNIKKLGLEQARAERRPLLVQRKRISKFASRKQEVREFIRG